MFKAWVVFTVAIYSGTFCCCLFKMRNLYLLVQNPTVNYFKTFSKSLDMCQQFNSMVTTATQSMLHTWGLNAETPGAGSLLRVGWQQFSNSMKLQ